MRLTCCRETTVWGYKRGLGYKSFGNLGTSIGIEKKIRRRTDYIKRKERESFSEQEMEKWRKGMGERGRRWEKIWQRGVIAERIERVQLHLMVGGSGVIAL